MLSYISYMPSSLLSSPYSLLGFILIRSELIIIRLNVLQDKVIGRKIRVIHFALGSLMDSLESMDQSIKII